MTHGWQLGCPSSELNRPSVQEMQVALDVAPILLENEPLGQKCRHVLGDFCPFGAVEYCPAAHP